MAIKDLKCPTCGQLNDRDAKRCKECGAWLLDEYWKATVTKSQRSILARWEVWVIIFGVLGIYFIVTGGNGAPTRNQITVPPSVSNTPAPAPNKVEQKSTTPSTTSSSSLAKPTLQPSTTQNTPKQNDSYYSQFSWHNSEFGVINDSATQNNGFVHIRGRAVAFQKSYSYVEITYGIYSIEGSKVGTAFTNITNLAKGTTWQFDAIGTSSVSGNIRYKLEAVSGH